jgi:hypothetical protein
LLSFRIHQLCFGRLHLLLLPKMTNAQMKVISRRLTKAGYSVEHSHSLLARSGHDKIRIDASGVCRSTTDIADVIIPTIPDILSFEKEPIPMDELRSFYLAIGMSGNGARVRISTRTESCLLWEIMRTSGTCGLSPDEHAMSSFLFKHARGECDMVTDFPGEESAIKMLGRRRYFNSKIDSATAAMTLRVAGSESVRNSYLPRDGMVGFASFDEPSAQDWVGLFKELGEWCYFTPE